MVEIKEKFVFAITEKGLEIIAQNSNLQLSPLEALMLLDVLKNEESNLRRSADKASPLPIRFNFNPSGSD